MERSVELLNQVISLLKELKCILEVEKVEFVTESKKITLEDVRKVLADISRSGKTAQVKELLNKYGANKLSEVDSSNYEALLNDAGEING